MKNEVIIFGGNHINTLGLVRSLGEKGIRPIVLLEPVDPEFAFVCRSRYIKKLHQLKSVEEGLDVLLRHYADGRPKPFVVCAGDPAMCLLDQNYDRLKDSFWIFNARGEQGRISFFADKHNQCALAKECGFHLIPTVRVRSIGDIPDDQRYPCFVKGSNSVRFGKDGMGVCVSRQDLEKFIAKHDDCMVQEYVKREYELDIVGLSLNHGQTVLIPAAVRKVRDSLKRQSMYVRLDDVREYPELNVNAIKNLVGEIGYEGIFSVEVMRSGGKYYFLEINLRNDAMGYVYTAAGVNYPYLWMRSKIGGLKLEDIEGIRIRNHTHLIQEHGFFDAVDGIVSWREWLRDYVTSESHVFLNWKDMKPFWFIMRLYASHAFRKVFKRFVR